MNPFSTTACLMLISLSAACGSSSSEFSADARLIEDAKPTPIDVGRDASAFECELELVGRWQSSVLTDITILPKKGLLIGARASQGTAILDISDPSSPTLVGEIPTPGFHLDAQNKDQYAYLSSEESGTGIVIADLSNPSSPEIVASIGTQTGQGLASCHNLAIEAERELLLCASTETGQVIILSIANPVSPGFVSAIDPPTEAGQIHDMYVRGNRLYAAWIFGGIGIYDISDASQPQLLGHHEYQDMLTHNLWPSAGDRFLFSTDETSGGHVRVWDIQSPESIVQVGQYQPNASAIVHNVELRGNRAYVSHYTDGLKVLDISDPANPRELASFDFYDGPDQVPGQPFESMQGAFGVAVDESTIYVSGTRSGLWILKLQCST